MIAILSRAVEQFLAVCEARNLSEAAEICGVTQPAISKSIGKLEGAIGMPLFQHSTRGLVLTQAGALLQRAGIEEFTIWAGADRLSYRRDATEALALSGSTYPRHRLSRVVNPHTGEAPHSYGPAAVSGRELATANAYAVALNAIGEPGLSWFPTLDGYQAVLVNGQVVPALAAASAGL